MLEIRLDRLSNSMSVCKCGMRLAMSIQITNASPPSTSLPEYLFPRLVLLGRKVRTECSLRKGENLMLG